MKANFDATTVFPLGLIDGNQTLSTFRAPLDKYSKYLIFQKSFNSKLQILTIINWKEGDIWMQNHKKFVVLI